MKDQASLNLLIVDSPIDSKALTGHLMLRATSSGLKVYDATGSETELGGGGEIDWSNVSASTINLSTTTGELKLMGASSMTLELPASNSKIHFEGASLNLFATDLNFNGSALNTAEGLVQLDESGRLPAVDGSQLTNLPAGTVDLSAYTGGINLNSTNDSAVAIKFNSGNPTYNAGLTMNAAGVTLSGYGDVALQHTGGSYLKLTSGEATLSSNASLALSAGSRLTISASEGIYLGAAGLNTAGGLVKVGDDGKIPAELYDAGSGGGSEIDWANVNSTEIKLNGSDGIWLTSIMNDIFLKPQNSAGTLFIDAIDIQFNEVGLNQPTGLVQLGADGKIPVELYDAGTGGDTSALEGRVTTLETTVGTLNTTVDEILADYGEGSGALVYRVVASATEPTNPTEGMIWIQTD